MDIRIGLKLIVIALFSSHCFCYAQEFVGSGTDCDETGNCSEVSTCIKNYHELDLYVRGNNEIKGNLTNAFFATGKTPSKFVKLYYKFQVSNDSGAVLFGENNTTGCANHESIYIWSDHFLYLLGPSMLFASTLFAVDITENETTIELPCLCYDVYGSLLSRLTYMSKVYAAMEYHDQPLQFISTHFIQVKDKNAGEYENITRLIGSFATFPLLGMPTVAFLTIHYMYPKIYVFMKQYAEYLSIYPFSTLHAIFKYGFPFLSCMFITFLLIALHTVSSEEFVKYGKEILHHDDLYLPYLHVACSWVAIIGLLTTCIVTAIYFYKKKKDVYGIKVVNHLTALVVSLNVIYLVCYFSPFMLLAFIHDPLVTTLTYCMIVFFIAILFVLMILTAKGFENHIVFILESRRVYKTLFMLIGIGVLISVFSIFVILINFVSSAIALGSFDDFQSLQTLLLSLLVGLVSFTIAKPVYQKACKHVNLITKTVSVEEQKENFSNIAANGLANVAATNILTIEDGDNRTEGMSIANKIDDDTLV